MKLITKLTVFSFMALGLSSCGFSKSVAQVAYNTKAQYDCESSASNRDSIHGKKGTLCSNGNYDAAKNPTSKKWNKDAVLNPPLGSNN